MTNETCDKHFDIHPFLDQSVIDNFNYYQSRFNATFVNNFEPYAIEIMRTLKWMKGAHKQFATLNFDSACNAEVTFQFSCVSCLKQWSSNHNFRNHPLDMNEERGLLDFGMILEAQ